MGIGTSKGAFYEDEHAYQAGRWDPKYDDNEITPNQMMLNKEGQKFDMSIDNPEGGIEISNHTGFRESDNIEDHREENVVYPDSRWVDAFQKSFGIHPQELFEFPAGSKAWNDLSKKLGYEDIKNPSPEETLEFLNKNAALDDPFKGGQLPDDNINEYGEDLSK